jgi:hypothetical protein
MRKLILLLSIALLSACDIGKPAGTDVDKAFGDFCAAINDAQSGTWTYPTLTTAHCSNPSGSAVLDGLSNALQVTNTFTLTNYAGTNYTLNGTAKVSISKSTKVGVWSGKVTLSGGPVSSMEFTGMTVNFNNNDWSGTLLVNDQYNFEY